MYRYLLISCMLFAGASAEERPIGAGWTAETSPDYQAGMDRKVAHSGHASLFLKSVGPQAKDAAARQRIRADLYRGKRIRLSGWVKPDQAEEGGALWLRVDMTNGDYILDAMLDLSARDRTGKDARGWTKCVLVSDVPGDALGISFGLRMKGKGQIWADDLVLDTVDKSVRTTMIERRSFRQASGRDAAIEQMRKQYGNAPARPVNLGFEQP